MNAEQTKHKFESNLVEMVNVDDYKLDEQHGYSVIPAWNA